MACSGTALPFFTCIIPILVGKSQGMRSLEDFKPDRGQYQSRTQKHEVQSGGGLNWRYLAKYDNTFSNYYTTA
jgi:hypothetical protein